MHTDSEAPKAFTSTGLSPVITTALTKMGFTIPTPIQEKGIPVALTGVDIIGIAETGTGKTMAFGLPILDRLLSHREERALIIVPTRELALQVEESIRKISNPINAGFRTVSLIGGAPIYKQIQQLRTNPSIIVATPGRLVDHLGQKTVNLSKVTMLVLDEADRMLDMGFAPQIKEVMTTMPSARQTMMFSATLAPEIARLADAFLKNPTRIEVATVGSSGENITQELCYVSGAEKVTLLETMLEKHTGTILVFSRTKHGATKLSSKIQAMGHTATEIHSNRSLSQRRAALDGFKRGKYRVLVATDVASRGIDVKDIEVVLNYDLPDASEDYVHRIGRTGRAGSKGLAISFATPDQHHDVKKIERLMKKSIPLSEHSGTQPVSASYSGGRPNNRNVFQNSRARKPQFAKKGWR